MIDLRNYPLPRVNSMTKYPSIPTFHGLVDGKLAEPTVAAPVQFPAGRVVVSEKVDGTNGRIVYARGDYFIGSREEFVYARGDYIGDKKDGLMDALKPIAERLIFNRAAGDLDRADRQDTVLVAYCEVYGGRINTHKQYTSSGKVGVRLFDVAVISNAGEMLEKEPDKLASWRDHGGQVFLDDASLRKWAAETGFEVVPAIEPANPFTAAFFESLESLAQTYEFLKNLCQRSKVMLDDDAGGHPEGIVARTPDRKVIAKLRLEDYERIINRRAEEAKRATRARK